MMHEQLEDAAREVHDRLGSGWSESIYHRALERELSERGIPFHSEGTVTVYYKDAPVGRRRPDMFVLADDRSQIVVELKAGSDSGDAQLDEYLNLVEGDSYDAQISGGALVQFNTALEFTYKDVTDI